MSPPSIVAGITVFKPRPDLLRALLSALVEEGLPVLVHVDGPVHQAISLDLLQELSGQADVRLSQSQRNDGLGAALGRLTGTAAAMGFEDIILFDQDTTATPGLAASLQAARARLRAAGAGPAIVGPSPVAPRDEPSKPPRYRRRSSALPVGPLVPVDYVITSGSLMCLWVGCHQVDRGSNRNVIDNVPAITFASPGKREACFANASQSPDCRMSFGRHDQTALDLAHGSVIHPHAIHRSQIWFKADDLHDNSIRV